MLQLNKRFPVGYKLSFVAYLVLILWLFSPYLFLNKIVSPHRQYIEIGLPDTHLEHELIENRKFNDYTNAYIPEISEHFNGTRSNWLTLWTNKNELGRPIYHISGFSPAYLPSWVITKFTNSPRQFITILSLLLCFLSGLFVILFCREVGLSPVASLIAGSSLAASPPFMYWLTFPMFSAVWCWAAGALWALTRIAGKPDLLGWIALAFSSYSLLMTAYPQLVIFHAYILASYGLHLIYKKYLSRQRNIGQFLIFATSAAITGIAIALPVYIDLAHLSYESARVAPDPSFFTAVLPKFSTLSEVLQFALLSTVPELFGNPIAPDFPFPYNGLSIPLLSLFFSVICLLAAYKKTWVWWLIIAAFCLFAFFQPLYVLGVKYLGFNLSRSNPLGSIVLPLAIIVAYGADALITHPPSKRSSRIVGSAVTCVVAVIAVGLIFGFFENLSIRWAAGSAMLILAGLLAAQCHKVHPVLLMSALIAVVISTSYPLMLRHDPTQIATTSPLIEQVRRNLPEGSRFAIATPGIAALPPNLNASLGLASVHSYNSLSPRRYHTLINALGGEVQTYGRWNSTISPDYSDFMFWMSNIGLMLSPQPLSHQNLAYLAEEAGIYLYKVISRMGEALQVVPSTWNDAEGSNLYLGDPRLSTGHTASKISDQGDILEFEVSSSQPSILVLSQKFHRSWQAQAYIQSKWKPARTAVVNDVFQGVILPPNTQRVRLEFTPWVRHTWIAHIFWSLLFGILALALCHKRYFQSAKER
jgi:hypothetical protein